MTGIAVNGVAIPEADVAREMPLHPASSLAEARQQAAEALVLRRLLLDEAARLGIDGADDDTGDDSRIDALIEQAVPAPTPDVAACRRYYKNNRAKFRSPDHFEAHHILLACAPDDLAGRDTAKEKAARIIAALQLDRGLFGEFAIAYSACRSRNKGGSLGSCERGDTVSELETYMLSLSAGELCPVPVESRYGVHVIELDRKNCGHVLPFEAVEHRIRNYLGSASFQIAVRHYLMHLVGRARIEGVEIGGTDSPLMQ